MSTDYPDATWVPADATNFKRANRASFTNIVIHITHGHEHAQPVAEMWQEPNHGSSAHFVVGQDGTVLQAVRLKDVAWHAHAVNAYSVGSEHCARTPGSLNAADPGLPPSDELYAASAKLVAYLCNQMQLAPDRVTIQVHAEIDKETTHADCPTGAPWDWDSYIMLVENEFAALQAAVA